MNRAFWPALLISIVFGAAGAVADTLDLRVGQPFPIHLSLPFLDDGRPSSASLFLGKKTIVQVFASW